MELRRSRLRVGKVGEPKPCGGIPRGSGLAGVKVSTGGTGKTGEERAGAGKAYCRGKEVEEEGLTEVEDRRARVVEGGARVCLP